MLIMFCSATPTLKKRSGWRAPKSLVRPAPARSAVSTTMRSSVSARSASSSPATNAGIVAAAMPFAERSSFSSSFSPALPRKTSEISCVAVLPAAPGARSSAMRRSCRRRLETRLDLRHHVVVVDAGEVADVPVLVELHPVHAATLDGVRDDELRGTLAGRGEGVERVEDGVEVVAVDALDVPAECPELVDQRLDAHERLGGTVDRQLVAVDDGDKGAGAELPCGHGGFPHLSLAELAVAEHAVGAVVAALHTSGEREAEAQRQPVPEGTGAEVDTGHLAHVRVVTEQAAEPGVVVEQALVEEADVSEQRVETNGGMALAEDEPVTVGPSRVLGAITELGAVQGCEQLGCGERPGVVPGAGDAGQPHGLPAHELGLLGELRDQLGALAAAARWMHRNRHFRCHVSDPHCLAVPPVAGNLYRASEIKQALGGFSRDPSIGWRLCPRSSTTTTGGA